MVYLVNERYLWSAKMNLYLIPLITILSVSLVSCTSITGGATLNTAVLSETDIKGTFCIISSQSSTQEIKIDRLITENMTNAGFKIDCDEFTTDYVVFWDFSIGSKEFEVLSPGGNAPTMSGTSYMRQFELKIARLKDSTPESPKYTWLGSAQTRGSSTDQIKLVAYLAPELVGKIGEETENLKVPFKDLGMILMD